MASFHGTFAQAYGMPPARYVNLQLGNFLAIFCCFPATMGRGGGIP